MSRSPQFSKPGGALTASVFYILLSLSIKERHGYEILKYVEANSEGRVRLGPGTLYTTLKRMLDAGLISELADRPDQGNDDARRRYYKLTSRGHAELGAELSRMRHALKLAASRHMPVRA
ncbi:MAG: PadR family transcriptional regulator [Chloroflexota bacterium]|nr:PadR family transcriptional regulator [Chloroflexota bacterium]